MCVHLFELYSVSSMLVVMDLRVVFGRSSLMSIPWISLEKTMLWSVMFHSSVSCMGSWMSGVLGSLSECVLASCLDM